MTAGLHTVHLRVNDSATGQPTPVRLRCSGPDGTYYAPFGRLSEFDTATGSHVGGNVALDSHQFAYIDGAAEISLPAGKVLVEVYKGPEYRSLHQEISLGVGQMAVRLTIERHSDLRAAGWYSGDTRCHFLSPHAALLEAGGEDLAIVNLLACEHQPGEKFRDISNILAFSGQKPALAGDNRLIVVNTLNDHPTLGALALLNCHRVVHPLRSGAPDGFDDWTLADWCDQCHRKGGLAVWANGHASPGPLTLDGEGPAEVLLGKIDAVEMTSALPACWYTLLNAGCMVPLVGASGKASNARQLGMSRTYARLRSGEEFSYKNWIEAIRTGRTFATRGPLLLLSVNEQDPGARLELPDAKTPLRVRAELHHALPGDRLEIVVNGAITPHPLPLSPEGRGETEQEIVLPEGGWLAALCRGEGNAVRAHTSPVYVQVQGIPSRVDKQALAELTTYLTRMRQWVQREGRFANDKQRADLDNIFTMAEKVVRQRKGAPGA